MDYDISKVEEKLKRLTGKLQGNPEKDGPVLEEIERVVSWLELFNTLLKGLIKMQHVVQKSEICHDKVKMLLQHREKMARAIKEHPE